MNRTPLHELHLELGARMVPFANYEMPVQYPEGILREHLHTRAAAGLFDVSHMGQVRIAGAGAGAALEALLPADLAALAPHAQAYSLLTNAAGGIRDDLIVTRWGPEEFFLVVNAGCKVDDIAYLRASLPGLAIEEFGDRALLALQGPQAAAVLDGHVPGIARLRFMHGMPASLAGTDCYITRSGYTGEDGFEISLPASRAVDCARLLLAAPEVYPIGLGARDSLRLEAGLCLYGHDLDTATTPIEAGLQWAIAPARREGGARAGGFPGADTVLRQLREGPARRRVGLVGEGKAPVREGAPLLDADGNTIGQVCSGGFGPTLGGPLAMAYVASAAAAPGTALQALVRDKPRPMTVTRMPFVPRRYHRG